VADAPWPLPEGLAEPFETLDECEPDPHATSATETATLRVSVPI
jgi:hypothetical protein